jgi:Family of unknown function (DUF6221)
VSDGIVKFIKTQLDEDEAAALAWPEDQRTWKSAGGRYLTYHSGSGENVSAINVKGVVVSGWERIYVKRDLDGLSDHIVRHDPAHVLAGVAAKRRVLARHTVTAAKRDYPDLNACEGCGSKGYGYGYRTPDINDCPELRDLAAAYANRPGFKPEWRLP